MRFFGTEMDMDWTHKPTISWHLRHSRCSGTYVDVPGCSVEASSSGENWPISTSGTAISIEEFNFTNEFNGCGALGIPNGFKAGDEGTATA
jgi:hypothetical protein